MAAARGISDIIDLCLELDRIAVELYEEISASGHAAAGSAGFWRRMADEEHAHVHLWERMQALARQGEIPELFEGQERVWGELLTRRDEVRGLARTLRGDPTAMGTMTTALCLEYYMVHPSLATLFQFWDSLHPGSTALDDYERHIAAFVAEFRSTTLATTQWRVFGDALGQLWRQTRTLAALTMIDELTGVLNRRGFLQTASPLASMAQRAGSRIGVVMADVDNFKRINDTRGHQVGDEVLRIVAKQLRAAVRSSDVVGRYGGEEFAVLLTNLQPGSGARIGESIRAAVEAGTATVVAATVSVGVCEDLAGTDAVTTLLSMIACADKAMYQAKRDGKNRVVCAVGPRQPEGEALAEGPADRHGRAAATKSGPSKSSSAGADSDAVPGTT